MESEEFEFLLSQYADGTLPEASRLMVGQRVASDPGAAAILAEYQKLDRTIRAAAAPLPELAWDEVARRISSVIPLQRRRRAWLFIRSARVALAASLIVAATLLGVLLSHPWGRTRSTAPGAVVSEVTVVGPGAEPAAGPEMVDVSVGRPPEAEAAASYTYASLVVQRPVVALDGFNQR